MDRSLGVITLVTTLVASAVLFAMQWSSSGNPTRPGLATNPEVERASRAALAVTQSLADRELQAYQASAGSFAGAQLSGISGATLLSSTASGYCLRVESNGIAMYEAGPGGELSRQPCT
jgi:hypothetical protein